MNLYAEIYNRNSSRYWKHGIFILREVFGIYYWYPFCELNIDGSTGEFVISCVLEKSDSENYEIVNEKHTGTYYSPRGHGYEFKPGDLDFPEEK